MYSNDIYMELSSLVKKLDLMLDELNQQGAVKFSVADHLAAKKILEDVEKVKVFRKRVRELLEEWGKISGTSQSPFKGSVEIADTTPVLSKISTSTPKITRTRATKGQRTNKSKFRLPILLALDSLGGSAFMNAVLDQVFNLVGEDLNKFDMERLPSDPQRKFWQNYTQWERLSMVKDGLLKKDSPKGVWELTSAGWEAIGKRAKYHQSSYEDLEP